MTTPSGDNMFYIKMPLKDFVEFAPMLIESLVSSMNRIYSVASIQKNVAIMEILNESSKQLLDLVSSFEAYKVDRSEVEDDNNLPTEELPEE